MPNNYTVPEWRKAANLTNGEPENPGRRVKPFSMRFSSSSMQTIFVCREVFLFAPLNFKRPQATAGGASLDAIYIPLMERRARGEKAVFGEMASPLLRPLLILPLPQHISTYGEGKMWGKKGERSNYTFHLPDRRFLLPSRNR